MQRAETKQSEKQMKNGEKNNEESFNVGDSSKHEYQH